MVAMDEHVMGLCAGGRPDGEHYASIPTDDIVLGTGVEDYFLSAFRFSADYHNEPAQYYTFADAGLVWFNRSTEQNMANTIESISAYKFHDGADLLVLRGGGQVYWEVRGNVASSLRSYAWLYSWPLDHGNDD